MNTVFYLGDPVDFSPVYPEPLPVELFGLDFDSSFEKISDLFSEYFPDSSRVVIDSSQKTVFHRLIEEIDSLNFPSADLFARVFLYCSFSAAQTLPPLSLWVPGNIIISDLSPLAEAVRASLKSPVATASLTYFGGKLSCSSSYIEKGEWMDNPGDNRLYRVKAFDSGFSYRKWKEINPNQTGEIPFTGNSGIFLLNSMKFRETLETDENLQELFYLLADAWKDERSIRTAMRDTVGLLNEKKFAAGEKDECFVIPTELSFEKRSGYRGLLRFLPVDENGNYFFGAVQHSNVRDVLAVNMEEREIKLENITSSAVFNAGGKTAIRGF